MKNLYFQEHNCEIQIEELRVAVNDNAPYEKEKIIKYLKNGNRIALCPKECFDVLDGSYIDINYSVLSDGEFFWRSDLLYYVDKYNVSLPEELIGKAYS